MTTIYSDADYLAALEQKRKYFTLYMSVLAAYLVVCGVMLALFMAEPYKGSLQPLYQAIIYILTFAFVAFSFPFLGIKYRRIRKYCELQRLFSDGIKVRAQGEFFGFFEGTQKDGVDVDLCIIRNWNERKHVYDERQFYIDREKPIPPFEEGDEVLLITEGNVLIEYEIIKKGEEE
ncbi:MAG: hypothetical protein ACI4U2_01540 [Christensenellaceae bacterium]